MKYKLTIGIIFILFIRVYSQSFPMDRWLDKVDNTLSFHKKHLSYPLLVGQNKNRTVDFFVYKYFFSSKSLVISVFIYESDKNLVRHCIPVDDYPAKVIKNINGELLAAIFMYSHIFVNYERFLPKFVDLEKIYITYRNDTKEHHGYLMDGTVNWVTFKYNCEESLTGLIPDFFKPTIVDSLCLPE